MTDEVDDITEHFVIAAPNYVDSDFYTVSFSGGDWEEDAPLTNLADPLMVMAAQSASAARRDTLFHVNYGTIRDILVTAIPEHTISRFGKARQKHTMNLAFDNAAIGDNDTVGGGNYVYFKSTDENPLVVHPRDQFTIEGHVDGDNNPIVYTVVVASQLGTDNVALNYFDDADEGSSAVGDTIGASVVDNIAEAPDGTYAAEGGETIPGGDGYVTWAAHLLQEDGSTGTHGAEWDTSQLGETPEANISFYLKRQARSKVKIQFGGDLTDSGGDGGITAVCDLITGEISDLDNLPAGAPSQFTDYGSYYVGDGWWRFWFNLDTTFDNIALFSLFLLDDDGEDTYTGFAGRGVYYWGLCAEKQNFSGNYFYSRDDLPTDNSVSASNILEVIIDPVLADPVSIDDEVTCLTPDGWVQELKQATEWSDVWRIAYAYGSLPMGHPSFYDGKVSAEDAVGYKMPYAEVSAEAVIAQYVTVEIDDTTNPDTYVVIRRLMCTPGWQGSMNLSYSTSLQWETDTQVTTSLGGTEFKNEVSKKRVIRGAIENLPEEEALQFAFEIDRKLGTVKQLFFIFRPDDPFNFHRRAFCGTLRTLSPLEFVNFERGSKSIEIREV